jgi:hypothetical protein
MRPADTPRTLSTGSQFIPDTIDLTSIPRQGRFALSSLASPSRYRVGTAICQEEDSVSARLKPPRVAFVHGAISFTDDFIERLKGRGMDIGFVGNSDTILRHLNLSIKAWDIIVYPIWTQWQRALDFAREARRFRERLAAVPNPVVLILSFVEQLPVTVYWFGRTHGTHYSVYTDEDNLVQRLRLIHRDVLEQQRASCCLHLRFVHSGNPSGIGCIPGEKLIAAYGSFLPDPEGEIPASRSERRFLNVLAENRWRFRNTSELLDLMRDNPFYRASKNPPSLNSIKVYVARAEAALQSLWKRHHPDLGEPPEVIAREVRGLKEVAYRLLCTAEFEHI